MKNPFKNLINFCLGRATTVQQEGDTYNEESDIDAGYFSEDESVGNNAIEINMNLSQEDFNPPSPSVSQAIANLEARQQRRGR
jgi:hypothetical protein